VPRLSISKNLVVVPACSNHDVLREHDCIHWHAEPFGDANASALKGCAVPAVIEKRRGHRRGLGVARFSDCDKLVRREERVDNAACAIWGMGLGSPAGQCFRHESFDPIRACVNLVGKRGTPASISRNDLNSFSCAGSRAPPRPRQVAGSQDPSKPNQPKSQAETRRGLQCERMRAAKT